MKKPTYKKTLIMSKSTLQGESIEDKVKRLMLNKEPIKDGAPIIYTEKKDGVDPAYNIRTDRFELATEAMDKVNRSFMAKRDDIIKSPENKDDSKTKEQNKEISIAESVDGTADNQSK